MKRAAGVIASGVVSLIGSLLAILLGIGLVLTAFAMRLNPMPAGVPGPPINMTAVLLVEAGILCSIGVIGIVSAIGLFKLKNWARISFLVFGGLLGFFSVMGMIGTFLGLLLFPRMIPPEQTPPPPGFITVFFAVSAVIWLTLASLSAWWLYYFTRRGVKEQFLSPAEIEQPSRGPLSVTIIAWLLTVGGCLGSLGLFMAYPVFLFGMVFNGWTARLLIGLFSLSSLVAGVGMLRWRPRAHTLALAVYGFSLLSFLGSLLFPGSIARMQTAMQQMSYPQNVTIPVFTGSLVWASMVFGVIAVGVPLWFLVTRRQAFLEACSADAGGRMPEGNNYA